MGSKVVISNAKIVRDTVTGETFIQCGCGDNLVPVGGGVAPAPTPGGASDCDWEIMKNKPFYHNSILVCGMDKQTIEIVQRENPYGTFFGGVTDGFGDIVNSTSDSGKGLSYDTNFEAGDRLVVTIDGAEYETIVDSNGVYGYSFGYHALYWGDNGPSGAPSFPFYMKFGDTGFELWMSEENAGTHEVSIHIYKEEHKNLDEEFIPDTIVRVGKAPTVEPDLPGGPHVIPAGQTIATNWSSKVAAQLEFELDEAVEYVPPFILATGEYVDNEGVKHFIPSIKWEVTEGWTYEWMGKKIVELPVTFFIEEPFEYDITVKFVSNYRFGGSMG